MLIQIKIFSVSWITWYEKGVLQSAAGNILRHLAQQLTIPSWLPTLRYNHGIQSTRTSQINPPTPLSIGRTQSMKIKIIETFTLHNYHVMVHAFILGKSHPCEQEGTWMPLIPLVSMNSSSSSPKTAIYSIWISTTIKTVITWSLTVFWRSYCHDCIIYIHQN